jgi:hypothetical protein
VDSGEDENDKRKPMISFLDFENRMKQQEIGNPALVLRFSHEV